MEFTWAQVPREAGATVHVQKLLCQTTLPVDLGDARRIDALATGLPLYMKRPLFCDATIRSPLHADGTPHAGAATRGGAVLARAQVDKERKYQDDHESPIAELITLAVELGGLWNPPPQGFLRALAKHKVRNTPCAGRRN